MGLWVSENMRRAVSVSRLAQLFLDEAQTPAQEAVSMLRVFRLIGTELLAAHESLWNQHWRVFDTPDGTPDMIRSYLATKRKQEEAQILDQQRATRNPNSQSQL